MRNNQLGRRNVTPEIAAALRGIYYLSMKKGQGGTGANQHKQKDQNDTSADTAEQVAKELAAIAGVSHDTVAKVKGSK
jgi:hypothetical protein